MMNITDAIATASVILSVIALFISYYSFRRTLHATSKPVLIFSMNSMFRWRLENVGSGPAINLIVGDKDREDGFVSITNCYPLSAGACLEVLWIKGAYELVAVYTDVYGNTFTTICSGSNRVLNRNQFPEWKPNQEQWFQMILVEGREESKLTVEDLKGKTAAELDIMRNEPYARRGYIFKRKDLLNYFSKQSWYKPITADHGKVFRQLSAAEKYEAHLILEYQNNNGLRTSSIIGSTDRGKPNKETL
jgi:hypothetical protein